MDTNTQPIPSGETAASESIWSGIYRVFYEPSILFAGLTDKKAWLVPLIIVAIVGGIIGQMTRPLYLKDMLPIAEARLEKYRQYIDEQRYNEARANIEKARAEAKENAYKWYFPLISLGIPLIFFLIIALIAVLFGKVFFGGKAGFWVVLNVVAFAALIGLLGDVFRGVMMLAKDTMMVYTGLGLLKPVDDGTFWYYLFRQIDAFSLWRIGVTAIGLGVVYKMSTIRFLLVLLPFWLVFICLVAFANIFTAGSIIY
ncbi:MAG: hypothetical protein ACOYVF_10405 [Candidatus Zixiibacteriota bacterium]